MASSSSAFLFTTLPALFIAGLALGYNYCYYSRRKKQTHTQALVSAPRKNKVLFFPDEATAHSLSSPDEVTGKQGPGSLSVLLETLQEAKESLDVCVFVISCKELADALIKAHHNGVVVRVISDNEQMTVSGSQIERLRKVGIQVRNDSSSYFMHHKFAVADGNLLVSGSLNWTLQGVCGNQENVMVTDVPELVAPFRGQFEKLWDSYDPERIEYYVRNATGSLSSVSS